MVEKFWTANQLSRLQELKISHQLPDKVVNNIISYIDIFDGTYGKNRKITNDGGYIILILPESDGSNDCIKIMAETLADYHLAPTDAEFTDILITSSQVRWHSDLYIVGSEYGIVFIYQDQKED